MASAPPQRPQIIIGKNMAEKRFLREDIQKFLASFDNGQETALEEPVSIPANSKNFEMHYASASIKDIIDFDISHAKSYPDFSGRDVVIIAKRCLDFSIDFEKRIQEEDGFFETLEVQLNLARERCEMIVAHQILDGKIPIEKGEVRVAMPGPLWPCHMSRSTSSLHAGQKLPGQDMQEIDRIWGNLPIVSLLQIVEQDHPADGQGKLHISLSPYAHYVELPFSPMSLMHMVQKLDALENPSN